MHKTPAKDRTGTGMTTSDEVAVGMLVPNVTSDQEHHKEKIE